MPRLPPLELSDAVVIEILFRNGPQDMRVDDNTTGRTLHSILPDVPRMLNTNNLTPCAALASSENRVLRFLLAKDSG